MGKAFSALLAVISRFVKGAVAVLLVPPLIGLGAAVFDQLGERTAGETTAAVWVVRGLLSYVALHLLLYKPEGFFGVQHALLSKLAVWLFGGQVATSGGEASGAASGGKRSKGRGKDKDGAGDKAGRGSKSGGGSALVIVSPHLIPLYTALLCGAVWLLRRAAVAPSLLDPSAAWLLGFAVAFHWVMTADDLQRHRDRLAIEMYLLALLLIGLGSLLLVTACLPWAFPEFSVGQTLAAASVRAQAIYATAAERLFF